MNRVESNSVENVLKPKVKMDWAKTFKGTAITLGTTLALTWAVPGLLGAVSPDFSQHLGEFSKNVIQPVEQFVARNSFEFYTAAALGFLGLTIASTFQNIDPKRVVQPIPTRFGNALGFYGINFDYTKKAVKTAAERKMLIYPWFKFLFHLTGLSAKQVRREIQPMDVLVRDPRSGEEDPQVAVMRVEGTAMAQVTPRTFTRSFLVGRGDKGAPEITLEFADESSAQAISHLCSSDLRYYAAFRSADTATIVKGVNAIFNADIENPDGILPAELKIGSLRISALGEEQEAIVESAAKRRQADMHLDLNMSGALALIAAGDVIQKSIPVAGDAAHVQALKMLSERSGRGNVVNDNIIPVEPVAPNSSGGVDISTMRAVLAAQAATQATDKAIRRRKLIG